MVRTKTGGKIKYTEYKRGRGSGPFVLSASNLDRHQGGAYNFSERDYSIKFMKQGWCK